MYTIFNCQLYPNRAWGVNNSRQAFQVILTHTKIREPLGDRHPGGAGAKGGEEGQGGQSWEQGHARLCAGRGLNAMRQRSHDPQRQGSRWEPMEVGGGGIEGASPGWRCERQELREINTSSEGWSKA